MEPLGHICAACRVKKSASLLTASIVFGVAHEEPVSKRVKCTSSRLTAFLPKDYER